VLSAHLSAQEPEKRQRSIQAPGPHLPRLLESSPHNVEGPGLPCIEVPLHLGRCRGQRALGQRALSEVAVVSHWATVMDQHVAPRHTPAICRYDHRQRAAAPLGPPNSSGNASRKGAWRRGSGHSRICGPVRGCALAPYPTVVFVSVTAVHTEQPTPSQTPGKAAQTSGPVRTCPEQREVVRQQREHLTLSHPS